MMSSSWLKDCLRAPGIVLGLLARDRAGNTMPMIAAAIAPLLALIGGGIDMGRSYLTETRLQQACDAGVLAARKKLGTQVAIDDEVPESVSTAGNRMFNVNFREGAYGSEDRSFVMSMENDYAVSAVASASVPTTIMRIFGYQDVPVSVSCEAQLNFSNTDVMMVLDVTGSMNETNVGDDEAKIALLGKVIREFYTQLESAKRNGARLRYGFVPYSTNVNVGGVLEDDWVTDKWTYQSRELDGTATAAGTFSYYTAASPVSGSVSRSIASTYAATFVMGNYICPTLPTGSFVPSWVPGATTTEAVTVPIPGTRTITDYQVTYEGVYYYTTLKDTTCTVHKEDYDTYVLDLDLVTEPGLVTTSKWDYKPIEFDVSNWRTETAGCIEERDTYEIHDYDSVDLDKALDLDIDRVPTPGDPDTQWRPMYPQRVFARTRKWDNSGSFSVGHSKTTDEYLAPYRAYTDACPSPARKLAEMSYDDVDSYVSSLKVGGSTYHDIGMIWGGRLISPTGLFASENADVSSSKPTSRNLIFLTDGQTSSLDISYSSYGIEPVDRRRWSPSSSMTLTDTVEARFAFACEEVKKRNINVWVVAFGTDLNPIMTQCAGPGRAFQANDGDQLADTFVRIANSMSDLRIIR